MDEMKLLDAVERYIRGQMNPEERLYFENLRKTSPEVDQLVVEHTLFLQQINRYGERKNLRDLMQQVHTDLAEQGKISSPKLKGSAKFVYLWRRYKRVVAIAACIAGLTAVGITALVISLAPRPHDPKLASLEYLVDEMRRDQVAINERIDSIDKVNQAINFPVRYNGTGFLIDPSGLMITNAHVVKNSKRIFVQNNRGDKFSAFVVKLDVPKDVAVIRIDDPKFKPFTSLPYGIRKTSTDIAEPVFTLGFPRDEIVYGEGYLSARSGIDGDTLSCQIAVPANPGNSGGPVFNNNGEVIGVLSSRQREVEGAVFAVQSKYIYRVIEEIRKNNSLYSHVKISSRSNLAGLSRTQQAQRIQNYVFMVKGSGP
ncbi:MAG TPA: S1C family serine protease [Chitinophagaceae bacterium]|nr:S1C family serine protease [Chitinophagaceae bacterium]